MKLHTLVITSVVSATAFAGELQQSSCSNCSNGWFAGAAFGQFTNTDTSFGDIDLNMYAIHVGRDLEKQLFGCDLAAYLELGLMNGDRSIGFSDVGQANVDVDVVPLTLNFKAERELFYGLKGYASAGAGYAFSRVSFSGDTGEFLGPFSGASFGDGGIYGQGSIGLSYDVTDNVEIFGGARYIVLDEIDFGVPGVDADNNVGYEVGLRYNF